MPSVALYTLGCKVSQYESEAIAELFLEGGFRVVDSGCVADAYVINTCTVTAESDRKSRQVIRRLRSKNESAVIAVIGCYSQRSPEEIERLPVDIIIGTENKLSVVDLVIEALARKERTQSVSVTDLSSACFEPMTIKSAPRTRAYVKIEDGCEAKCTYCAISAARGPVRSKPKDEVISEVEGLAKSGVREIVLTGIETGSYGRDFNTGYGLADLICELDSRGSAERIRLGSLAPELVGREFADRIRGVGILTPHFHLSMQSGSDSVLRRMKRRYNRAMALRNIEALRDAAPGACFTTDLMVGFPGETEEDFLDTVEFVRRARFIACHVFAYSRRAGTPAADYPDQIPESVKRERSSELIRVSHEVRDEVLAERVVSGEPLRCILETYSDGMYTSHSDEFIEVCCETDIGREGEIVLVRPLKSEGGVIYGEIIE